LRRSVVKELESLFNVQGLAALNLNGVERGDVNVLDENLAIEHLFAWTVLPAHNAIDIALFAEHYFEATEVAILNLSPFLGLPNVLLVEERATAIAPEPALQRECAKSLNGGVVADLSQMVRVDVAEFHGLAVTAGENIPVGIDINLVPKPWAKGLTAALSHGSASTDDYR
jgi:hypothetical protein